MTSKTNLVQEIQALMSALGAANATTRPTPWLNLDLSMTQLKALIVLHHLGAVRVGAVARAVALSPNATTAVLDHLVDEGYARRDPDPADRRAVLVGLTEGGADYVTTLLSANMRAFGEVLEHLSTEELEALRQGMAALQRATLLRASGQRATAAHGRLEVASRP
ncbi:MAG: MarR family transcriptional regulator [Dehalococcoidia bacterium]|nr:MarR family transcriptional regulator [Dehalococcoidia bacterium]